MRVYTKIELTWDENTQRYFKSAEESYDYIGPVAECGGGGGGGFGGFLGGGGGGGKGFSPLSIVGQLAGGVLSGAMSGSQESAAPSIHYLTPPPAPIAPPTVDDSAVKAQQETERRRLATQGRRSTIASDFLALENTPTGTAKTLLG